MNMQEKERASAPTLMEVLRDVQAQMLDLEARIVDLETGNDESEWSNSGISDEYYGDGMRGEHNAD